MYRLSTVIPSIEMYNSTKWRNRYLSKFNFVNVDTSLAIFFTFIRSHIRFSVLGTKVLCVFCWVMALCTSRSSVSFYLHQQLISFCNRCLKFLQKKQYQYRHFEITVTVTTINLLKPSGFFTYHQV